MRFNKKFKEAFNAKYNYSNEEFEAKIRVTENTKKTFKPKLRYSMTLILTTMILTAVLSIVLFNVWLGENKKYNDNVEKEMAEQFNAEYVKEIVEINNYDIRLVIYEVGIGKNTKNFLLYYDNVYYEENIDIRLEIKINEFLQTIIKDTMPLDLNNQLGELSVDIFINDHFKCNFTQIID